MLICSIYGQKIAAGPYFSYIWPMVTQTLNGQILWSLLNILVILGANEREYWVLWSQLMIFSVIRWYGGYKGVFWPPQGPIFARRPKNTIETTSKACLFGVWGCFKLKSVWFGAKPCLFWPPNMTPHPPRVWDGSRRFWMGLRGPHGASLSLKGVD